MFDEVVDDASLWGVGNSRPNSPYGIRVSMIGQFSRTFDLLNLLNQKHTGRPDV
jgi:hypothetical protein